MDEGLYKEALYNFTKTASYFLWEYTKCEHALNLWRCAEDIAFYAERHDVLTVSQIQTILHMGKQNYAYSDFIRNIAFRIYLFTGVNDSKINWFTAERLAYNMEWCAAITGMANIFKAFRNKEASADILYSDKIKRYYKK